MEKWSDLYSSLPYKARIHILSERAPTDSLSTLARVSQNGPLYCHQFLLNAKSLFPMFFLHIGTAITLAAFLIFFASILI